MTTALLVKIVFVMVLIAIAWYSRRKRPVILGMEQVRADAAEAQRLARGTSAPSPMPKEEYRPRDQNLFAPEPGALDQAIREAVDTYGATTDVAARATIRDSVSIDEIYTLATFARRAAAFGMRDRDPSWIESGLTAVAMFDVARMDPRDVPLTLAYLHHASARLGGDSAQQFARAAELADSQIAAVLRDFPRRDDTDLTKHWGAIETRTGFLGHGSKRWRPTGDLQQAAVRVAAVIDADRRYEVSGVQIADTLPFAWLHESAARVLRKAHAGASVSTSLVNGLTAYLVEMPDADGAAALQRASLDRKHGIGIARGSLFCLLQTDDETPQTLQRFVAPIAEILDTTS